MTTEREYLETITYAPKAYDGFGTVTIEERVGGEYWREYHLPAAGVYRRVLTPTEHVGWQRARYASGGYFALTLDDFTACYNIEYRDLELERYS